MLLHVRAEMSITWSNTLGRLLHDDVSEEDKAWLLEEDCELVTVDTVPAELTPTEVSILGL